MIGRSALRLLLLGFRKVLHSLPDDWRKRLRSQHGLMSVYAKALHTSHLFYGTLPKHKLQARYDAIVPQQTLQLEAAESRLDSCLNANCLIIASDVDSLNQTLHSLSSVLRIGTIFVYAVEEQAFTSAVSYQSDLHFITKVDELSNSLPLVVLRSGQRLHSLAVTGFLSALESLNESLLSTPHVSQAPKRSMVITSDTDYINENSQRSEPECYPHWDPDLQLASGYIDASICVVGERLQRSLIATVIATSHHRSVSLWLADLAFSEEPVEFKHVPLSLLHRTSVDKSAWYETLASSSLANRWPVSIQPDKTGEHVVVQWPVDENPLVSIIIPTRNAKALVETCIQSILEKTEYRKFEILLIDNQSDDSASLRYFEHLNQTCEQVRVIEYPYEFNYSAINNFAVEQARGSVLAFVNNDIEVINTEWLTRMVGHVCRSDVGCVGAKLYYPNRRIQHAGVVMGYGGGAGHAHKYFPDYHTGYLNRIACTNTYSAVTAACLLICKQDFNAVGGFNERSLAVAFNDVDLCLKVVNSGKRNVYCAEAELFHHESVSRGSENTPEKRARFEREVEYLKSHWGDFIASDPAYNPNLTLRRENFALKE